MLRPQLWSLLTAPLAGKADVANRHDINIMPSSDSCFFSSYPKSIILSHHFPCFPLCVFPWFNKVCDLNILTWFERLSVASEIAGLVLHLEATILSLCNNYSNKHCFSKSHLAGYDNEVQRGLPSYIHFAPISSPSPHPVPASSQILRLTTATRV